MAKKYKNKSEFLQKQYDDKEFGSSFNFIMKQKGIDSTHKLVYNLMCNDSFMNGRVTWKQSTYADKLGLSRQQMSNIFNIFIEAKVLIPDTDNKPGSKSNSYILTLAYNNLVKKRSGFKKAVKQDVQTCKPQLTQHVNQDVQTCKPQLTYNTNNTCTIHVLKETEEDLASSVSKPKKTLTDQEILQILNDEA